MVLQILGSNILFANLSTANYLGHIISKSGIAVDPLKLEAIANLPQPSNPIILRCFHGLTGYYKKFIKRYGGITDPLNEMLKKGNF